MLNTLLPILLFAALALAVLGALRRVAMWRRGRASKVDLIGGLFAMPKRYMVDLHHVVARDKYIANTHVATAGGAVASIVLAILVHGFGLHNRILGYALLLMTAVMFAGAIFVYRRRLNPPSRLSKGPWMRLPKSLLAFSASFFLVTLPVAGILPENFGGWVLAAILGIGVLWGVSELFFGMTWGGPMKHAFAAAKTFGATVPGQVQGAGLAPSRRTFWRRPFHRFEAAGSQRPECATGRGKTQGFHLEPIARFRRLRAVR